jgi:hypothetical protein
MRFTECALQIAHRMGLCRVCRELAGAVAGDAKGSGAALLRGGAGAPMRAENQDIQPKRKGQTMRERHGIARYLSRQHFSCAIRRGLTLAALGCCVAAAHATPLSLDVTGKIARMTDPAQRLFHFSEAQILALPAHSISTSTSWTPKSTFTGPLLADILKTVGAYGDRVEVHTYDDYTYTVPVSDTDRYGVIVAYSMNGQRLKISDFGPLFLIYPRDAYPAELTGGTADAKFVWQIKALIVK